jgi:hypothetical protein
MSGELNSMMNYTHSFYKDPDIMRFIKAARIRWLDT